MYYDVHTHAFHPKIADKVLEQLHDHYGITAKGTGHPEDLLERATKAGLDRVVVHTAATAPDQVIPANNWSIDLAKSDERFITFGTMHPDYDDPEKEFAKLERHGIKGLKFHPDFQGFFMDEPKFYRLLEMVQGRFAVMFHVGDKLPPEKNPSCPIKLRKILDNFPKLTCIAAHMGGYCHWKWASEELAGYDVYMDTSSAIPFMDKQVLLDIMNKHPRERILFGSDYPLFDPEESLKELQHTLKLKDSEMEIHMSAADALFE
ncbi:amidohydrolase family protein [Desulfovibrio sp. JC010]|uniref:amidohydrolase family protein n=1 Tax=Desulfovibrio sp. JC010 TaxID=2593641 RepID=UPI0013D4A9AE|nr:amidohydrolase family protein [Desulfovibrio sp. JC010]NDV26490.1 amidohydrolase family protein [Desulfovibrio sp. JC010]